MRRDLWKQAIDQAESLTRYGKVRDIVGLVVEALGPADVALGELCYIGDPGRDTVRAEVVGFRGPKVLLMPLGQIEGIRPGTSVFPARTPLFVPVGPSLLGRVLDGLGNPIDGKGPLCWRTPKHACRTARSA